MKKNQKRLTKVQREQLKLTSIQIEIVHGSMLGGYARRETKY
jgi:hypothetical protein